MTVTDGTVFCLDGPPLYSHYPFTVRSYLIRSFSPTASATLVCIGRVICSSRHRLFVPTCMMCICACQLKTPNLLVRVQCYFSPTHPVPTWSIQNTTTTASAVATPKTSTPLQRPLEEHSSAQQLVPLNRPWGLHLLNSPVAVVECFTSLAHFSA